LILAGDKKYVYKMVEVRDAIKVRKEEMEKIEPETVFKDENDMLCYKTSKGKIIRFDALVNFIDEQIKKRRAVS